MGVAGLIIVPTRMYSSSFSVSISSLSSLVFFSASMLVECDCDLIASWLLSSVIGCFDPRKTPYSMERRFLTRIPNRFVKFSPICGNAVSEVELSRRLSTASKRL